MRDVWPVDERLGSAVQSVRRDGGGGEVPTRAGAERFDQVVLACHSDQALALLADASDREHAVLGAMRYQANDTVLHTDASLLPANRKAGAAWNAFIPRGRGAACTVSYCMNLLQGFESPEPCVVTLTRSEAIDPAKMLRRMRYQHPLYSHASVAAQKRKAEIQGQRRTWFAGAYWGWGFHEDGMRSDVERSGALGRMERLGPCRVPGHGARGMSPRMQAATGTTFASAVYEGVVRHRRHGPHPHAFGYRIAQLYLDLDEVERVFD